MQSVDVNLLAVGAASILNIALGYLWYSQSAFGNQWMKLVGLTKKEADKQIKKNFIKVVGGMVLASVVMTYVLAQIVALMGASTLSEGIAAGLWVWFGFVATTMIMNFLYAKKTFLLYAIESGYQLACMLLAGGLLAMWR